LGQAEDIDNLLQRVTDARREALPAQARAKERYDLVDAVLDRVHGSWSGSWAGYHAHLYYGEFERPGFGSKFNVEWGGLRGFPRGWQDRSDAEVTVFIERTSGVTLDELERFATSIFDVAHPLYLEAQALVTPILEASGDTSRALLDELVGESWGISQAEYLRQARPSQIGSRDSAAICEGMKIPPHVVYRARVVSEYTRVTASVAALDRAALALRQAKSALSLGAMSRADSESCTPVSGNQRPMRLLKWLVVGLIALVAVETLLLLRSYVIGWFDRTFTQEFFTTPTRFGFAWADVAANAVAALVLIPFGWLMNKAWRWLATS
jgi:hypothetical protein